MPKPRPLHAIPLPVGMDPRQRITLAIDLARQALACKDDQPAEAALMLEEARRQLGQARSMLCPAGEWNEE